MAVTEQKQTGCRLPEGLRRYYLDTMGIQLWQALEQPADVDVAVVDDAPPEEPGDRDAIWRQLESAVANCEKCELHKSRTQAVLGVGNRNAELLIIGEAPGRDEDLQGEPFVGRAGRLLNAMLAAIGYKREQVYIANILKCRPPNNRDPSPDEAEACHSWLQQQIELIQPDVMLVLGRIAAQKLLNTNQSLGALRGRQHDYGGVPLLVSYHPAYLLRKPIEKRKSWQDLKTVRSLLNKHGR